MSQLEHQLWNQLGKIDLDEKSALDPALDLADQLWDLLVDQLWDQLRDQLGRQLECDLYDLLKRIKLDEKST